MGHPIICSWIKDRVHNQMSSWEASVYVCLQGDLTRQFYGPIGGH